MNATLQPAAAVSWQDANWRYLQAELRRLRLAAERRALWLRRLWASDGPDAERPFAISDAQANRLLQGEDRGQETVFHGSDPAALRVGAALGAIERELEEQRRQLRGSGRPAALETLARLFDLTPFERDVLLLCFAPVLDAGFERLFGYLHDDATRNYPTPSLAIALLAAAGEETAAWHSFQQHAPLRHFGLITTGGEPAMASLSLRLPERLCGYLLGFNQPDAELARAAEPVRPARIAPAQSELAARLAQWSDEQLRRGEHPRLCLTGLPGGGRREMAAAICRQLGLSLFAFDWRRLSAARPDWFGLVEREAVLLQFAVLLEPEPDALDATSRPLLEDLVRSWKVFLMVGAEHPAAFRRPVLSVAVPKADAAAQAGLWLQALPELERGDAGRIVEQFDLGPALIEHAAVQATSTAAVEGAATAAGDVLWRTCLAMSGSGLEGMAQRIDPCHRWDDLVVPAAVRRLLEEIAAQVAHRTVVYRDWGFGATLNRGRGISVLFAGASGTGKTLAAEVLAAHLRLQLYRIDLSSVVSKYIGETEKNLRRVFDAAESSGAVLFFDEADALFGKRSEVKDSHDRYANVEIDYLLQRMEDYRGLAILATNRKDHLDTAFLRRLRFVVDFPMPDAEHRRRIWEKVFPAGTPCQGIRFDLLSRLEIPGANIRNIALNAAFLAAAETSPVGMSHLKRAAQVEFAKEERIMTHPEFGGV